MADLLKNTFTKKKKKMAILKLKQIFVNQKLNGCCESNRNERNRKNNFCDRQMRTKKLIQEHIETCKMAYKLNGQLYFSRLFHTNDASQPTRFIQIQYGGCSSNIFTQRKENVSVPYALHYNNTNVSRKKKRKLK